MCVLCKLEQEQANELCLSAAKLSPEEFGSVALIYINQVWLVVCKSCFVLELEFDISGRKQSGFLINNCSETVSCEVHSCCTVAILGHHIPAYANLIVINAERCICHTEFWEISQHDRRLFWRNRLCFSASLMDSFRLSGNPTHVVPLFACYKNRPRLRATKRTNKALLFHFVNNASSSGIAQFQSAFFSQRDWKIKNSSSGSKSSK